MLSQIKFNLSTTSTNVDLVALTLADLGFDNEEASLTAVYSRAPSSAAAATAGGTSKIIRRRRSRESERGSCRRRALSPTFPAGELVFFIPWRVVAENPARRISTYRLTRTRRLVGAAVLAARW